MLTCYALNFECQDIDFLIFYFLLYVDFLWELCFLLCNSSDAVCPIFWRNCVKWEMNSAFIQLIIELFTTVKEMGIEPFNRICFSRNEKSHFLKPSNEKASKWCMTIWECYELSLNASVVQNLNSFLLKIAMIKTCNKCDIWFRNNVCTSRKNKIHSKFIRFLK